MNEPKSPVAATVNSLNQRGARRTTRARLRAGFAFLFGTLLLAAGFVVLSESPASADNCKQLVKSIGDLANKDKMKDCLRTGSRFGTTIGTVVAVSGTAIALVGLSKPKPPPTEPEIVQSTDACERADRRADRLANLKRNLQQLESDVLKEFNDCADGAQKFSQMFRDLKELNYRMNQSVYLARTGRIAGSVGLGIGLLGFAGVGAAAETTAAAVGGSFLSKALSTLTNLSNALKGSIGVLEGAVATSFADTASGYLPGEAKPIRPGDPGAPAVPGVSMGGHTMVTNFWSSDMRDAFDKHFNRLFNMYLEDAQQFNRECEQWGSSRREQVQSLRQEINEERNRWTDEARDCPRLKDALPPVEEQAPFARELITWQIPQARTEWGPWWPLGGYWTPLGGSI